MELWYVVESIQAAHWQSVGNAAHFEMYLACGLFPAFSFSNVSLK